MAALRITRDDVLEFEPHSYVTEHSDLGLAVGDWPERIETDLGNKLPLRLSQTAEDEGDLLWVVYRQELGCVTVKIFND